MQALLPSELIEIARQDQAGAALSNCVQRIDSLVALLRTVPAPTFAKDLATMQRFEVACAAAIEKFKRFWSEHSTCQNPCSANVVGHADVADVRDLHLLFTAALIAIEYDCGEQAAAILRGIGSLSESSVFAVVAQAVGYFSNDDNTSSLTLMDRALKRTDFTPDAIELIESFRAYVIASNGGDSHAIAARILTTSTNCAARHIASLAMH